MSEKKVLKKCLKNMELVKIRGVLLRFCSKAGKKISRKWNNSWGVLKSAKDFGTTVGGF